MASPLTGCKETELIYISTEKFELTIKGQPCHPSTQVLNKNQNSTSRVLVSCADTYNLEVFSTENYSLQPYCGYMAPIFFEHQNYEIVIENLGDSDITFWHDNSLVRDKVGCVGKSKKILSGVLNFGSDIGFTELKVLVDGENYLIFSFEIFPSKIDYYDDYINILNDINNEIYNLAFDFLKRTYLWANIKDTIGSSLTEFFSIISLIFNKFNNAIDTILKTPHHVLQYENKVVPFHKIKKNNLSTLKWLEKHPQYLIKFEDNFLPQKALTVKKEISFDTFENRFIKHILKSIMNRLKDVKMNYLKLKRSSDDHIIKTLDSMYREIERRLTFSFLKNVGELYTINSLSLVLNMAPGYKDVYKYYLMLIKGLSLNGEVFKTSVKDLAVLYEYWCFIKLNSLLKNKYKLIRQDLIKIDNSGLFITLAKGKNAQVTYENPSNGEKFTISYNPMFTKLPTISQKPDNILSLEKHRSKTRYEYVFDAKYRINPALNGTDYKKVYDSPGPEEDDINTMHRYRDAIVYNSFNESGFERTMFGAFVLFPYSNENEYLTHKLYTSIEKVNVGGLPFLPSATSLVEQILEELINDSPESAFERTILQKGTYDYINNIDFKQRDVLVGSLRNSQQLEICLTNKFYHIPYKNIKNTGIPFKYVALYQSQKAFNKQAGILYLGEVDTWEVVKRKDIKEVPKDSDELYVRFDIKEWTLLDNPVKPREYGVLSHIYTNKDLLTHADFLPELCIKSKEEYRLYMELKRAYKSLEIKATDTNLDNSNIASFNFEGSQIIIADGRIKILKDSKFREFLLDEFNSKPRTTVNLIKKFIYEE